MAYYNKEIKCYQSECFISHSGKLIVGVGTTKQAAIVDMKEKKLAYKHSVKLMPVDRDGKITYARPELAEYLNEEGKNVK